MRDPLTARLVRSEMRIWPPCAAGPIRATVCTDSPTYLESSRVGRPQWIPARTRTSIPGMWRGPALADFTYEPFAQRAIAALDKLRIDAVEDRFRAELALGGGGRTRAVSARHKRYRSDHEDRHIGPIVNREAVLSITALLAPRPRRPIAITSYPSSAAYRINASAGRPVRITALGR